MMKIVKFKLSQCIVNLYVQCMQLFFYIPRHTCQGILFHFRAFVCPSALDFGSLTWMAFDGFYSNFSYACISEVKGLGLFVCVEVLRPSQPNGVISSAVIYLTTLLLGRLSSLNG